MDVFLMIRRKKTTLFLDAKDNTTVLELKRMVEGITKKSPTEQKLYKDETVMEDDKTLAEYGLTNSLAKAQSPAEVGLAFSENGVFEELDKTPYSSPPELPDVMKPGQEASTQDTTTTA